MSRSRIVGVAGLVLAAVLGLVCFRAGCASGRSADARFVETHGARAELSAAPPPNETRAPSTEVAERTGPAASDAGDEPRAAPFGDGLALVCALETGARVSAAELHVLDPGYDDWSLRPGPRALAREIVQHLESDGVRYVADAHGCVVLPRPRHRFAVLARAGEFESLSALDPSRASPLELVLRRRATLTIHAADRDGAPIPDLGLRVVPADASDPLWVGRTDARGSARVGLLGDLDPLRPLRVLADLVVDDARVRWWMPWSAAERTLEFVLPRPRTVELVFLDARRRPFPFDGEIQVACVYPRGDDALDRTLPLRTPFPVVAGRARVDCAPQCSEFSVWPESGRGWTRALPVESAQLTRLELAFDDEERVPSEVELRSSSGEPLASTAIGMYWQSLSSDGTWRTYKLSWATCDAQGRVRTALWCARRTSARGRVLVFDPAAQPPRFATVAVPDCADRTTCSVRAELGPAFVACGGRVLDESGLPIPCARVSLRLPTDGGPTTLAPIFGAASTDGEGRFLAFGPEGAGAMLPLVERDSQPLALVSGAPTIAWGTRTVELRVANGSARPTRVDGPVVANCTLRLVDVDGVALDHGFCLAVDAASDEVLTWAGGELKVPASRAGQRCDVWAPGFDVRRGELPATDAVWSLERSKPLRVTWDLPASWKHSALTFEATLERVVAGPPFALLVHTLDRELGPDGGVSFDLPPGTYELSLRASWTSAGRYECVRVWSGRTVHERDARADAQRVAWNRTEIERRLRAADAPLDAGPRDAGTQR